MSRKGRKYPSKFFKELVKTTYADQHFPIIKSHGWEGKSALVKEFAGEVPIGAIAEEFLKYVPVKHHADASTTMERDDVDKEILAWAFAVTYQFQALLQKSEDVILCTEMDDWYFGAFSCLKEILETINEHVLKGGIKPLALAVVLTQLSYRQFLWRRNDCVSYVLSPDLAEMMAHTKLDQLPVDGLRLPFPSLVLAPPDSVMKEIYGETGCIFIYECEEKGHYCWDISVFDTTMHSFPIGRFRMDEPGKTVQDTVDYYVSQMDALDNEFMARVEASEKAREFYKDLNPMDRPSREMLRKYVLFICACMVYAVMPDADVILAANSPEYAAWVKSLTQHKYTKHERRENDMMKSIGGSRRYYLGRGIKIIDRHIIKTADEKTDGVSRVSPRLHWRSGHYRRVWHGSGEDKHTEVHWIQPTLVGVPQGGNVLERRAGMR